MVHKFIVSNLSSALSTVGKPFGFSPSACFVYCSMIILTFPILLKNWPSPPLHTHTAHLNNLFQIWFPPHTNLPLSIFTFSPLGSEDPFVQVNLCCTGAILSLILGYSLPHIPMYHQFLFSTIFFFLNCEEVLSYKRIKHTFTMCMSFPMFFIPPFYKDHFFHTQHFIC